MTIFAFYKIRAPEWFNLPNVCGNNKRFFKILWGRVERTNSDIIGKQVE